MIILSKGSQHILASVIFAMTVVETNLFSTFMSDNTEDSSQCHTQSWKLAGSKTVTQVVVYIGKAFRSHTG